MEYLIDFKESLTSDFFNLYAIFLFLLEDDIAQKV